MDGLNVEKIENRALSHYGILGMKWGIRKDRGSSGRGIKGKDPYKMRPLTYMPGPGKYDRVDRAATIEEEKNLPPFSRVLNVKNNSKGSGDYQKSRAQMRRGTNNLSTKEIKDLNQRLQLEKQLKDLQPNKYKKGMDIVKAVTAAGTAIASLYELSKTPLAQDIIKAIAKKAAG